MASASSSASTGINAPGGSNNKNNPAVWIFGIVAVVIIAWLKLRKKG